MVTSTRSLVTASAPVRVDLAGGVTDVPAFAELIGTDVTNLAVDLFADDGEASPVGIEIGLTAGPDGSGGSVVVREAGRSAPVDCAGTASTHLPCRIVESLLPPSWTAGASVDIRNDLPRRTGLGASSTLAVCLVAGVEALTNDGPTPGGDANTIVKRAHHAEVVTAGVVGGFQDFVAAYFGGVNHITFSDLGPADLTSRHGRFGLAVPDDLRRHLDANLVIVTRTERTISSDAVVADHVRAQAEHPDEFARHLRQVKERNAEVFPLLTRPDGALDDRVRRLGAAMTASWDQRKLLSPMVGGGALADIEAAVRPLCLGIHGPGSGVNSLLFLGDPRHGEEMMAALDAFRPDIVIFRARVNTTGVRVRRTELPAGSRQDAAASSHP